MNREKNPGAYDAGMAAFRKAQEQAIFASPLGQPLKQAKDAIFQANTDAARGNYISTLTGSVDEFARKYTEKGVNGLNSNQYTLGKAKEAAALGQADRVTELLNSLRGEAGKQRQGILDSTLNEIGGAKTIYGNSTTAAQAASIKAGGGLDITKAAEKDAASLALLGMTNNTKATDSNTQKMEANTLALTEFSTKFFSALESSSKKGEAGQFVFNLGVSDNPRVNQMVAEVTKYLTEKYDFKPAPFRDSSSASKPATGE